MPQRKGIYPEKRWPLRTDPRNRKELLQVLAYQVTRAFSQGQYPGRATFRLFGFSSHSSSASIARASLAVKRL